MEDLFNLSPGRKIGRSYRVISHLGSGWEGEVYKVEEIETGIIRVAKFFYETPVHGKLAHIQYARKLFSLRNCPTIIQYHHKDFSYIKGKKVNFLVSEFIDGIVLSEYINSQRGKRFNTFEALHIFRALAQGIANIHKKGEYHGDIHEENILIRKEGLGFCIHFIDILHLGRCTKARRQDDVFDMISLLYMLIGGSKHYHACHPNIKKIILGRKKSLISKKFPTATEIVNHIDSLQWNEKKTG